MHSHSLLAWTHQTYLSLLSWALWPKLTFSLNPFTPCTIQCDHCNDKVSFKVYCVSFSAVKQEASRCHHDTVPRKSSAVPQEFAPRMFRGDLAWVSLSGQRVTTTLALSLVVFIQCQKSCMGRQGFVLMKIYSCLGSASLPSQVFFSVILKFLPLWTDHAVKKLKRKFCVVGSSVAIFYVIVTNGIDVFNNLCVYELFMDKV